MQRWAETRQGRKTGWSMTGVEILRILSLNPRQAAWLEACTVPRGPLWGPLEKQHMLACLGDVLNCVC